MGLRLRLLHPAGRDIIEESNSFPPLDKPPGAGARGLDCVPC